MYHHQRNGKIKLDRLKKDGVSQPDSPSKSKSGKLTIIEMEAHQKGIGGGPGKSEHRNKTKIAAAIHMQRQN